MPASMKKIAAEVVASLKTIPSPEKKGKTFWDYLKDQLYSESTWDKDDLKVIEKEIHAQLNKLEKKELADLWKDTDKGFEKSEANKKIDPKEMKEDLTDEILGMVMDRMDDNYSSRDSYFSQPESSYVQEKEGDGEESDDEAEPDKIDDEDFDMEDEDLFGDEDNFEEDDESRF